MRTTVTLEKDVASRLQRLRKKRPFKQLVNEALRAGLDEIERAEANGARYRITPVKGEPRRLNFDCISELIAELDGDDFR